MNDNTDNLLWYTPPDIPDGPELPGGRQAADSLVVALRPNISVCRWPAYAGSKVLENYRPVEDAEIVTRLRNGGARLPGMSRMSELGFGVTGETSHLLVLNNRCNAFLGTDATGEMRYLAAIAGLWGYKPSYGACSTLGVNRLLPSMESPAVIADSPSRIARLLSTAGGGDERDAAMLCENLPDFGAALRKEASTPTIGIIPEQLEDLPENDKNAFEEAIAGLSRKNFPVKHVSFPDIGWFRHVHQVIGAAEASSAAGKYDGVRYGHRASNAANWNEMYMTTRREAFGSLIKSYLFQGAYFQFRHFEAFAHACRLRGRLLGNCRKLFETIDLLASPVRSSQPDAAAAESVEDVYDALFLTLPANVTGLPSLCIPGIATTDNTDLGLQLTGRHLSDEMLLNVAVKHF